MKILVLADEESKMLWDFFDRKYFKDIDLIVSCGDLKAEYLSFLVTLTSIPVLYVHGNHDTDYDIQGPDGCICIDDRIYVHNGIRIMGLGGCNRYKKGKYQYTQREMNKRAARMKLKLWYHKGIDILVTHAPAEGVNDDTDPCHQGFTAFNRLILKYKPQYFVHGHVHMSYGRQFPREDTLGTTRVINAYDHYIIEI